MAQAARVPLLWPESWDSPRAVKLLDGSPVNHLISQDGLPTAVQAALPGRDLTTGAVKWQAWSEVDWSHGMFFAIGNGAWPGAAAGENRQEGGPTGSPWVDANGWILQLAQARAPIGSEIWLNSEPPAEPRGVTTAHYLLALSEAWAYGGRRPVWLTGDHAREALAGSGPGHEAWQAINALLRWQLEHDSWRACRPVANLLVVSDFAGPNEFMAGEVLNLAARQNIAFTPVETARLAASTFTGRRAALYVDQQPPPAPTAALLRQFVRNGGLLLAMKNTADTIGQATGPSPDHPRFDIRRFGQGRIAVSKQDYDDPWILARDAHLLMSRRWDSIRLFNAGSLLAFHAAPPGGAWSVVHVLNYACRPSANLVSLQLPEGVGSAVLNRPGSKAAPARLERRDNRTEIDIPPFPFYCALELKHAR